MCDFQGALSHDLAICIFHSDPQYFQALFEINTVFAFAAQYGGFSVFSVFQLSVSVSVCISVWIAFTYTRSRHSTSPRFDVINSFGISAKFLAHTLLLALSSTRSGLVFVSKTPFPSQTSDPPTLPIYLSIIVMTHLQLQFPFIITIHFQISRWSWPCGTRPGRRTTTDYDRWAIPTLTSYWCVSQWIHPIR